MKITQRLESSYWRKIVEMVGLTSSDTALGRSVRRYVNRHTDENRYFAINVCPTRYRKKRTFRLFRYY